MTSPAHGSASFLPNQVQGHGKEPGTGVVGWRLHGPGKGLLGQVFGTITVTRPPVQHADEGFVILLEEGADVGHVTGGCLRGRNMHSEAHGGLASVTSLRAHCPRPAAYISGLQPQGSIVNMTTVSAPAPSAVTDTFPINGTDYIEFFVGQRQAGGPLLLLRVRLPHRGVPRARNRRPRPGQLPGPAGQGALRPHHGHEPRHARSRSTCTATATACATWRSGWTTRARPLRARWSGARSRCRSRRCCKDEHGEVIIAAIRTYGDTIHSLVERRNYKGLFMPGFRPDREPRSPRSRSASSTSITASATSSSAR